MRPISLEMEGFTSFRERVLIDFSKFDLFAITGPTGAGKTSIIDAITYALYGFTPRLGKQSISELISQGADRLKVLLEFSSGKDRFRIGRETKWTGKSSITTPRLEQWIDEKWVSLADRVSDVDSRIEKIIGLDFNGFTKSVVLPQGQFDVFLKGKAEERRRILSDLLKLDVYETMMKRANEIAQEHTKGAELRTDLLKRDFANSTPAHLDSLKEKLTTANQQLEPIQEKLEHIRLAGPLALELRRSRAQLNDAESELRKLLPQQAEAEKGLAVIQERIKTTQKEINELERKIKKTAYDPELRDQLVSRSHRSESLQQLRARLNELDKTHKTKSKALDELEVHVKKAEAAVDASQKDREKLQKKLAADKKQLAVSQEKFGKPESIKILIKVNQERLKSEERKDELEEELARLIESREKREQKLGAIKNDLKSAESALKLAKSDLELLQKKHAAEELKHLLEKGEPCPVCEQEVTRVPKSRKHPSVDEARNRADENEERVKLLVGEASGIAGELGEMDPQFKKVNREIERAKTAIGEAMSMIRGVLKKAPASEIGAQLQDLYQTAIDLQAAVELTNEELNRAQERESKAKDEREKLIPGRGILQSECKALLEEIARLKVDAEKLESELGEFADLELVMSELKKQDEARRVLESLERSRKTENETLSKAKDDLSAALSKLEVLRSRVTDAEGGPEKGRSRNR